VFDQYSQSDSKKKLSYLNQSGIMGSTQLPTVVENQPMKAYMNSSYKKEGLKSRSSNRSRGVPGGQSTQISTEVGTTIKKNAPLRQSNTQQWKPGGSQTTKTS